MKAILAAGLLVVLSFGLCFEAQAARANYAGTWNFHLTEITQDSACPTSQPTEFTLVLTQTGELVTAVPSPDIIVGVSSTSSGLVNRDGVVLAEQQSCPIVPDPACSTTVKTLAMFPHSSTVKPKRVVVSFVFHSRTASNAYECSTLMKGTATKQGKGKGH